MINQGGRREIIFSFERTELCVCAVVCLRRRCKYSSRRPKLTSSVISDVKPIIYIFTFTYDVGSSSATLWRIQILPQRYIYRYTVRLAKLEKQGGCNSWARLGGGESLNCRGWLSWWSLKVSKSGETVAVWFGWFDTSTTPASSRVVVQPTLPLLAIPALVCTGLSIGFNGSTLMPYTGLHNPDIPPSGFSPPQH